MVRWFFPLPHYAHPPSCSWRVTHYGPGAAGEQDEHESAVCSSREEGQAHAGLHWQACSQQLWGNDSSPLVLLRPHLAYCVWVWPLHLERDNDVLKRVWQRDTRMVRRLELVTCVWSVWIGASSGEGKISLQSYLSSVRLCVKNMEPGSSLKKEKGWEAMAISSCNSEGYFGYWEKYFHSQDGQTPEVTQRGVEYLSLEGLETGTNGIIGSLLLLFLEWLGGWSRSLSSSLPAWVSLWSHSVTLININSSWLKKQNKKIMCFKNEYNLETTFVLQVRWN